MLLFVSLTVSYEPRQRKTLFPLISTDLELRENAPTPCFSIKFEVRLSNNIWFRLYEKVRKCRFFI